MCNFVLLQWFSSASVFISNKTKGAITHDPTVFLFWDIFESKDDFDAAREESDAARDLLDFDEELLVEYEGTI